MNRLRVFVGLLVFAVAVGGGLLLGQDSKDGSGKVRGQLPPNWGKLGLTDKQKQTVYRIQADYKKKIDPLAKQIDDLKKKEQADLRKVLTEDQRARLKEIISTKAGGDATPKESETPKDKKQ